MIKFNLMFLFLEQIKNTKLKDFELFLGGWFKKA